MRFDEFHSRNVPKGELPDELTEQIIGAAIEVHRHLGLGLNEAIYQAALCHELGLRRIPFTKEVPVDVLYKGAVIGKTRIDLLVAERVIVELKACEGLSPIHRSQCITYLTITGKQIALLINFNVEMLKDGIKRIVRSSK